MKRPRYLLSFMSFCLLWILAPATLAQDLVDDACALLVTTALDNAETMCADVAAGFACYAHGPIEAESSTGPIEDFSSSSALVDLERAQSLHTGPADVAAGEWGVVRLVLPNDESSDLNKATSLLMVGDATLEPIENADGLPAFTLSTSDEKSDCVGAPHALIIENPEDSPASFMLNGAQLQVNSTVIVFANPAGDMQVFVVSGSVSVTANDETVMVTSGYMTVIQLGGDTGLVVISVPSEPEAFDPVVIESIPFHVLLTTIEIPAIDRWTNTGVDLTAGQSYMIIGSHLVKTIDYMPWSTPDGHSSADCGAAGRGDWDCKCRSSAEWGQCTLDEVESMRLVGRVGEGAPFIVGPGGFFVAKNDGELQLGANDNTFTDNVGAYRAYIQILGD